MFCSTVIPTVARATLGRAVASVLGQQFDGDDFEVIVVNDSGRPLPAAQWQAAPRVRVVNTQRRERSTARNVGAALASGRYLHFLDDDDWLYEDAWARLWPAAVGRHIRAEWLYGDAQFVDAAGREILLLRGGLEGNGFAQVMGGAWMMLQSSLILTSAFWRAGGFHPLMPAGQDTDLGRRIALHGDLAYVPARVARVSRGEVPTTTLDAWRPALTRMGREEIVNQEGAFARLRGSATTSYWKGRVLRLYLTSAYWNLAQRPPRLWTAASRGGYALASLVWAAPHAVSPAFWQAVARPYQSVISGESGPNAVATMRS